MPEAGPIHWDFDENNPVIRPGQLNGELDANVTAAANVVQLGDRYLMFYWSEGRGKNWICMAESPVERPNEWRGLGHVIGPNENDGTRAQGARWPWALALDEKTVFLYYLSRGVMTRDEPFPNTPCLAISEDGGETWREPSPSPVIGMDTPYDRKTIGTQCIVRVGDKLHMYYTAAGNYVERPPGLEVYGKGPLAEIGIGLAVSDDGLTWQKPYDHFLIPPRLFATEPYETKVAKPCVVRDGDLWRMWVSCLSKHYRTCSLVSHDAIHWHWQPAGVEGDFGTGPPGSFDDQQRCYAMVVKHGHEYRCWYTGSKYGATGMGYALGTAPSTPSRS